MTFAKASSFIFAMSDYESDPLESSLNSLSLEPYLYDPIRKVTTVHSGKDKGNPETSKLLSDRDSDSNNSGSNSDQPLPEREAVRTDNLTWRDRDKCVIMTTAVECTCCQGVEKISQKLEEVGVCCITDHGGFIGNCLNKDVIETSIYEFLEHYGPTDDTEPIKALYRHIAYRRFTRWIWHRLGRGNRKSISSCAVSKIREQCPSQETCGFRYQHFD